MTGPRRLRLGHLYPVQMSLYGDGGNILCLRQRAAWRGWTLEVVPLGLGAEDGRRAATCDGFFFGGGQDRDQARVADDLLAFKAGPLGAAVATGRPLLAVCGGYQMLGTHYRTLEGVVVPGLGLLDLHTIAGRRRAVGNVVVAPDPALGGGTLLVGFENHSGRTFLGPRLRPLGRTVVGAGNNGVDSGEGVLAGSVIGTYLHGPLLPRNPDLADWWLARAIAPGDPQPLLLLDDTAERVARERAVRQAHRERSGWRRAGWRRAVRIRPGR
ncbi:MAG TPA: glutamine amidotransferase [Verrucomicrobiae bacterium]|nr:glutamine amidotransferase [Verrucomicrobiae bacterium]